MEFKELFPCETYAYMWKGNPLAAESVITMEQLKEYPCLSFEQGDNNSFYFAEEVLRAEKPVLLDMYADWCGPCQMMAPELEAFAEENDSVKVCDRMMMDNMLNMK